MVLHKDVDFAPKFGKNQNRKNKNSISGELLLLKQRYQTDYQRQDC